MNREGRELPIEGVWLEYVQDLDGAYDLVEPPRVLTENVDGANAITSKTIADADMHKVLLDIDFPVKVIPSTTEGHNHLYIDKEVPWGAYVHLLEALVECGVLEQGYLNASVERGHTTLRLPWVPKEPIPRCAYCEKRPSEFPMYQELASEENITAAEYVRRNEGTYNPKTNHFACDACYIAIGQPSSPTGWVAP